MERVRNITHLRRLMRGRDVWIQADVPGGTYDVPVPKSTAEYLWRITEWEDFHLEYEKPTPGDLDLFCEPGELGESSS